MELVARSRPNSRRGAHIAIVELSLAEAQDGAAACRQHGVDVRAYECNVSREDQVCSTLQRIADEFGRFDVLVNNAGVTKVALLVRVEGGAVVRKMSLDQWQSVIDVNLTGVFLCGREAAAHMIRFGNGGAIVNLSSISHAGNAGQTNYSAAKAGVVAMTVVWAKELARYGIRSGSISPGLTRTEMVATMKPEILAKLLGSVPLGRAAEVDEIAKAAVFIAENDFFSGRSLDVDGGMRL